MPRGLLTKGSSSRTALIAGAAAALLYVFAKSVLPGSGGRGGTPDAILFQGAVFGALNALTAMGIVLIYRTSRIVNFAQAALGVAGAAFTYNLGTALRWPYGVAFLVGVAISALIGLVTELFLRKFFLAPRLVVTIVTIGLAGLLAGTPVFIQSLNIWGEERGLAERFGGVPYFPFPDFSWRIRGFPLPFHSGEIMAMAVVALAIVGLSVFFRYTRMGIAVRASAENADRAQLLGINVRILSTVVWTLAGALSGAGIILYGTVTTFAVAGQGAIGVLIAALAAAVLARMRSLPLAALAALALSVLREAVSWSYKDQTVLIDLMFFLVILIGLIVQRKELQRGEELSSWEATQEIRPTPKEMLEVSGVRLWRWVLVGGAAVLVALFPWVASTGQTNLAGVSAITGIVLLSLVVLTGWAGQVSLGQFGFVAIGAAVGGALTAKVGLTFWLAIPAAAAITAVVAVIVGLPALRIKGLYLGVTTLAFAFAVRSVLFNEKYFSWLLPSSVQRPGFFLFDFEDERSMYYLTVVALGLSILVVVGLRRSRPGRVLIALRENETELQSFGVNVVRTKLAAFALAGFLCGVAGVLFAHHQRAVTPTSFEAQESISLFIYGVIGGISSISGAILGSSFQAIERILPSDPLWSFFFNINFGLLVILYIAPGGLASILYKFRDGILRIVAQRRQMVVPSLFADYDPAAAERQLIPLSEPMAGAGLEALPEPMRFRLTSELYDRPDEREKEVDHAPDERRALLAAAGADDAETAGG